MKKMMSDLENTKICQQCNSLELAKDTNKCKGCNKDYCLLCLEYLEECSDCLWVK